MKRVLMSFFETSFKVNAPLEQVWAFHDDPIGLTKIMSFPLKVVLNHVERPVQAGSRILMTWWFGPLPIKWNITVREKVPQEFFTDVQPVGEGPFAKWEHTHAFERIDGGTRVIDRIHYEFPFGALGRLIDKLMGKLIFKLMFAPRAKATRKYLESMTAPKAL
jgi:ligand-binding SRPBCC domain-containing protein